MRKTGQTILLKGNFILNSSFICNKKLKQQAIFNRSLIGFDKKKIPAYNCTSFLIYVLGVQKSHLIEMVLLSTHNIYFG